MTLAQNFIASLDPHRDRLYAVALASVSAAPSAAGISPSALQARAEVAMQSAIRETFAAYEKDSAINPARQMDKSFGAASGQPPPSTTDSMPADIWARLVATVQVQAARSAHSTAINPDSVLVNPDPLLAPKKNLTPEDGEGLDLPPASRFLLAGAIAILIGIVLTIYLLTRSSTTHPTTQPDSTTHPAATSQAATTAP